MPRPVVGIPSFYNHTYVTSPIYQRVEDVEMVFECHCHLEHNAPIGNALFAYDRRDILDICVLKEESLLGNFHGSRVTLILRRSMYSIFILTNLVVKMLPDIIFSASSVTSSMFHLELLRFANTLEPLLHCPTFQLAGHRFQGRRYSKELVTRDILSVLLLHVGHPPSFKA